MILASTAQKAIIGGLSAAVVLLGGLLVAQTLRLADVRVDLASEQNARANDTLDRQALAADYAEKVRMVVAAHTNQQNRITDEFNQRIAASAAARAADADSNRRLLDGAEARAAGYRTSATTDFASCQRLADLTVALDRLAAEGKGLVDEGRGVVERRDAEVNLLLQIINNDRAAINQQSRKP